MIQISNFEICNLSRIPTDNESNPCYKTVKQIIDEGDNFDTNLYKDTELYRHYNSYNPITMYDMYNRVEKLKNYSAKTVFLPWIYKQPLENMRDIAVIEYENEDFVCNQLKKIKKLIESFTKNGYNPNLFPDRKGGNVTGYFLKKGKIKKFYIVSGNHRVSVFFALFPDQQLSVAYEDSKFAKPRELMGRSPDEFLQVYDIANASQWPSVKSGFLTTQEAIDIAEVYINV